MLGWIAERIRLAPAAPRVAVPAAFTLTVFLVAFAVMTGKGAALLKDADTLWHVFVGESILASGRLPTTDTYSHTMAGAPWIAKEWLSQVGMALAHRAGGYAAVALLAAGAAALAIALIAREAATRLPLALAVLVPAAAFMLMAGHTLARPHVLAWPVLVGWTIVLMRAAEDGRAPNPLWAVLIALWANLHGSYLFGLALVPAFGLEAVLRTAPERRVRVALGWAVLLAAAVAASMAHGYGPGAFVAAFKVIGLGNAAGFIAEWAPTDLGKASPAKLAILAGIAALALSPGRFSPVRVVLLVGLFDMAVSHERHLALLGLIAPVILIEPIAARLGATPAAAAAGSSARLRLAAAAAGLAALVSTGAGLALDRLTTRPDLLPTAALAAAEKAGVTGRVFNEYEFGGALITAGIPTFIDGRTELFGPDRLTDYVAATTLAPAAALERILADPAIGWTLLRPDTAATALLDHLPGWTRVHADTVAVVHRRR